MWEATVERFHKGEEKAKLTGRKMQIAGTFTSERLARTVKVKTRGLVKRLFAKVHSFDVLRGHKPDGESVTEEVAHGKCRH